MSALTVQTKAAMSARSQNGEIGRADQRSGTGESSGVDWSSGAGERSEAGGSGRPRAAKRMGAALRAPTLHHVMIWKLQIIEDED